MKYFEGIKVGTKVESIEFGKGVLETIVNYTIEDEFKLQVRFTNNKEGYEYKYYMYNHAGKRERQDLQTLFYPGVKVIQPERN